MANEITINASLKATKLTASVAKSRAAFAANWTTARHDSLTQTIGTTHEALSISADIATLGWAHVTNVDPTNYIDLGVDVAGAFNGLLRLKPGESQVFRFMPGAVPYARANTAPADLEWTVMND